MVSYRWLVASGFIALSLTSCSAEKSGDSIAKLVEPSIVLITYEDRPGNGTGFFVAGEKNVCTVLTARHVTAPSSKLQLQTRDLKIWKTSNIRRFLKQDLALVTFDAGGQGCPYKPLELGNSENVKIGSTIHISGFPGEDGSGKINRQFVPSNVSAIENIIDGYAISYTATTAGGMSGGPVLDTAGKVIAVHGRAGTEVARLKELKSGRLLQQELSEVGVEITNFKWAIPINTYVVNLPNLASEKVANSPAIQAEGWWSIGNEFYVSGFYEAAIVAYEQAIKLKSDYVDAWIVRGAALGELKRYNEAIASFDKAIEIKRDYADAWAVRGVVLGELKRYNEAISSYNKAIEIEPNYAEVWYNRGVALGNLQQYQEAIASYDKAIQINPDNAKAWYNRGVVLDKSQQYEEAIASYEKAIQIKADDAEVWTNHGTSLLKLERYNEAIASFDKAIQIKPDSVEALSNRGYALIKLRRYNEAIVFFEKAIQINPDSVELWTNQGTLLALLGQNKEALESVEKALKINPNDQKAQKLQQLILQQLGR